MIDYALNTRCDDATCPRLASGICWNCGAPLCLLHARLVPPGDRKVCLGCFETATTTFAQLDEDQPPQQLVLPEPQPEGSQK